MRYSVEKTEEDIVTLYGDDDSVLHIKAQVLGFEVFPGDILILYEENGENRFVKDKEESEKRKKTNIKRLNDLFKRKT
ncbi:MAG: DUF3006 family protein [Eubacteriales bacterium]